MRTKYQAFDGKLFDKESDCENYELRLTWIRRGFDRYAGDIFYGARFLAEECNVSPSFAFMFTSLIQDNSDQGFTRWIAEHFDDLVALGARLKSASQYIDDLSFLDRRKAIAQCRKTGKGYKAPEINFKESANSFVDKLAEELNDPFQKAAAEFLSREVEGFEEVLIARGIDLSETE